MANENSAMPARQDVLPSFTFQSEREQFARAATDLGVLPVPVVYTDKTIDQKPGVVYVGNETLAENTLLCLYPVFIVTNAFLQKYEYVGAAPYETASAETQQTQINLREWRKLSYPVIVGKGARAVEGLGFPAKWYAEDPKTWYPGKKLTVEQRIVKKLNEPIQLVDPDARKLHEDGKGFKLFSLAGFRYRPPQMIKVARPTNHDIMRLRKHLFPNIAVDPIVPYKGSKDVPMPGYFSKVHLQLYATQKIYPNNELLGCYGESYIEVDPNFHESEECRTPGIYKKMEVDFDSTTASQPAAAVPPLPPPPPAPAPVQQSSETLEQYLARLPDRATKVSEGTRILEAAVQSHMADMVEFLLKEGHADPNIKKGKLVLMAIAKAFDKRDISVLRLILNDRRVNLEAVLSMPQPVDAHNYREMINSM